MNETERKIRISQINYTNVWPIYFHFPFKEMAEHVQFIKQVPTQLNREMAAGRIDMGPISAFAYADNIADYMLMPDLSVSAYGRVNSILFFHKKPWEEAINGSIALPTTSASSVNLLKIIVERFYQAKPRYRYEEPDLDKMMENADGALLIGDDAIRASWSPGPYQVVDLGQKWLELTGHWMTFAVWAIQKSLIVRHPELVDEIYTAFQRSKQYGLEHPETMIREAETTVGGTTNYWRNYFGQLCYDFGPEQWKGLQLYFDYAFELGLLNKPAQVQIWSHTNVI